MEITKVVKPFIRRGWTNTFGNIVYVQQQYVLHAHNSMSVDVLPLASLGIILPQL